MKTDYKLAQKKAREMAKGRPVPEEEWDDHDKLFIQEQTTSNRKSRRGGIDFMKYIKRQQLKASAKARSKRERRSKSKI